MNQEYINLAQITCSKDLFSDDKATIMHMIVGLLSEMNEIETAIQNRDSVNVMEECGDCFWYIANLYRVLKKNDLIDGELKTSYPEGRMIYNLSKFADVLKKYCVYNFDLKNNEEKKKELELHLNMFYTHLVFILESEGYTKEFAMDKNIKKLQARFPQGFDEYYANNRNLNNELNILSE